MSTAALKKRETISLVTQPPLRVVLIDEELPYPPTSGKRIRTYNLVKRLAPRHHLTYVCHRNADAAEAKNAAEHFRMLGIQTVVIPRAVPSRSGASFYFRLMANLLSPLPFSVQTHTSSKLINALQSIAKMQQVDLWHCEWTPYVQSLNNLPGPRLVMAHNVETTIWQRYHETATGVLKRWYIQQQWKKYKRFETTELAKADLTVAVSRLDATRFREEMQIQQVEVVENGVDVNYFKPTHGIREVATMLFLGSLDWRPNLDGLVQFLTHVYPNIRQARSDSKLLIVGRNPPKWLKDQAAVTEGVELHANCTDVRPFLARAGMLVVPLRIGGGSRLKILEALASGLGVVSTRVGAEGLDLEHGDHIQLVEQVEQLAELILQAMRQPAHLNSQANMGRERVLKLYDWELLAAKLESKWQQVANSKHIEVGGKSA